MSDPIAVPANEVPPPAKLGPLLRFVRTLIQTAIAVCAGIPVLLTTTDLPDKWDGYIITATIATGAILAFVSGVWNLIENAWGRNIVGERRG